MMLQPAIFAALVVVAVSADYDPYILTLRYDDGRVERVAATGARTCEAARAAIQERLWQPAPGHVAPATSCAPGDLFERCGRYIVGFNAPAECGP